MAKRIGDINVWVRTFEVTEPTRHRKGFTVYKVSSTVFSKSFPESATKIVVWKRYSDFKKLHKELEQIFKQLYLKGEFPAFPKAKVFGRFEHEVVEERRNAALILLQFTANHTQLFTSKAFMQFFENGYSTKDFLGHILFSRGNDVDNEEPPTTVSEQRSDISSPCLQPEIVWNVKSDHEEDCLSLSPSSISSSISPENPEMPPAVNLSSRRNTSSTLSDLVSKNDVNGGAGSSSKSDVANVDVPKSGIDIEKDVSPLNRNQSSHQGNLQPSSPFKIHMQKGHGIVRSATVTDDLSSYFDEEFEDTAFLFPTGSCSSLDALPGFSPAAEPETETPTSKASSTCSTRGMFSLPRRKTNGFGLFDFLPLFPKKAKPKAQEKEKLEVEKRNSLSVGYICEAAGHFAVAQFHESNADYTDAFNAYKEGVRVLLAGAQDDTDRDRKLLAKNKLEKYLSRAEMLKDTHLTVSSAGGGFVSPVFSSPNRKAKCLSVLDKSGRNVSHHKDAYSSTNLEELKLYKVVGLGPPRSKILVVMNPSEAAPRCYATKVLWKSPWIIYPDKETVIPVCVPFMVKLYKWFETPDKIVLLLEHAGGGRLIEFVKNYQHKRLSIVTPDDQTPEEDIPGNISFVSEALVNQVERNQTISNVEGILLNEGQPQSRNESPKPSCSIVVNDNEEVGSLPLNNSEDSPNGFHIEEERTMEPTEITEEENPDTEQILKKSKALLQTVSEALQDGCNSNDSFKSPQVVLKPVSDNELFHSPEKREDEDANTPEHESLKTLEHHAQQIDNNKTMTSEKNENNQDIAKIAKLLNAESLDDLESDSVPKRMVPEGCVKVWAAEIVMALEGLHQLGLTYGNLHIRDILMGENGHILLCYKSLWNQVDDPISWNPYMAPEIRDSVGVPLWKIHTSADWWSVGAILFLLLTGQSFSSAHPEGVFQDMVIKVPDSSVSGSVISKSSRTLLAELLQYQPTVRLGYYGAAEIKSHPFFDGFDWTKAFDDCMNNV
ncbi:Ribosomal protein S6 kinase delta-1 [Orchesella cincta]|uniref:Ribosomal protein S6 kinase delta-1 n=1 Tax=Orchesella cincta TaxID=48709 RepID=A0A1D2N358_ORCCI|nr:Ribosomal protein S6 kinase delta-1 [Orchesella cincta]